jgi:hypothetical protein
MTDTRGSGDSDFRRLDKLSNSDELVSELSGFVAFDCGCRSAGPFSDHQ